MPTEAKTELQMDATQYRTLREASDKAQLGKFIGDRWDTKVCVPTLDELRKNPEKARFAFNLEQGHEIGAVVLLDSDAVIKKQADGFKIPDALIVEVDSNDPTYVMIRSCDFKFNLSMADKTQVSPRTLSALLEKSGAARTEVQAVINDLVAAGKLKGDFNLSETLPDDQSQAEFLALDQEKRIRAVTGKYISPDTEENRQYFHSGRGIYKEHVYTRPLTNEEIGEFMNGLPGSEFAEVVDKLSFGEGVTKFDEGLLKARAAAAMKAMDGVKTLEQLKHFIEHPEEFKTHEEEKKADPLSTSAAKKLLGPLLKQNMVAMQAAIQSTVSLEGSERFAQLEQLVASFKLDRASAEKVMLFLATNIQTSPTTETGIAVVQNDKFEVKSKSKDIQLTPIKDELTDDLFVRKKASFFLMRPSTEVPLTNADRDFARAAIDVYKQRYAEEVQVLKTTEDYGKEMKIAGRVTVQEMDSKDALSVTFVTTAHQNETDGGQFISIMLVDRAPNLETPSPINQSHGRIIARMPGEDRFTIFGLLGDLESRYGPGNVRQELKTQGFEDIAIVRFSDFDRYIDGDLTIASGGLTASRSGVPALPAQSN